jgi:hypothetical protein
VTFALAVILFAALMLYCGIKGKSLRSAIVGKAVDAPSGSLIQGASA